MLYIVKYLHCLQKIEALAKIWLLTVVTVGCSLDVFSKFLEYVALAQLAILHGQLFLPRSALIFLSCDVI